MSLFSKSYILPSMAGAVSDYSYDAKNYDEKMAELCASVSCDCSAMRLRDAGLRRSPSRACHRRHAEGGEFWSDWDQSFESFDQMDLHENLLRGIYAYGWGLGTQVPL